MKKIKLTLVRTLIIAAIASGLTLTAYAQVGDGPWTQEYPTYTVQLFGSGWNNGDYFGISDSNTSGEERAERRYEDFSSGTHQFQGDVYVYELGGDRICLKQTFQDNAGPWDMIAISKDGYLYAVESGDFLADYAVGDTAQVNTICYVSSAKDAIWINGSLIEYVYNGTGPYYHKCGTYRTGSGYGPIHAEWSNVSFWYK